MFLDMKIFCVGISRYFFLQIDAIPHHVVQNLTGDLQDNVLQSVFMIMQLLTENAVKSAVTLGEKDH